MVFDMEREVYNIMNDMVHGIIFEERVPNIADALIILNWLDDHRPTYAHRNQNGFLTLSYCGRCGTIVGEGDKYCSQCGRGLVW